MVAGSQGDDTLTAAYAGKSAECGFTVKARPSSGGSGSTTAPAEVTVSSVPNGKVTVTPERVSKGGTVTLTATPDAGYKLADILVKDANGSKLTITENADGTYSYVQPAGKVTVTATFVKVEGQFPFADVPENNWARDGIAYAYEHGLFTGISETTFAPDVDMTREQVWMVLARMSGQTPASMGEARAWALENSISDGNDPIGAVSREQFVTLLWRTAGEPVAAQDMSGYTDFGSVAGYAKEAMRWAVENGVINGTSPATLSPAVYATRAQIAVILARYSQSKEE